MSRPPSSSATGRCRGFSTSSLRARHRRLGARRARQLAPRQDHRSRREARGRRLAYLNALAARRHLLGHRLGAAGRRSGDSVEAARRDHGRLYHERADRGRGPARGDERGLGPDPRARAGRRLRRQGGVARRRADDRPRQQFLQEDARFLRRDHAGRRAHGDAALAHPPGADDHALARRSPAYQEAKAVEPPKAGADKSEGAVKGDRPLPPVGQLAALDFPADRPHQAVERDPGRLRAAHGGAGDPGRDVVRRRRCRRFPASRGLAAFTTRMLDEGTGTDLAAVRGGAGAARRRASIRTMAPTAPM